MSVEPLHPEHRTPVANERNYQTQPLPALRNAHRPARPRGRYLAATLGGIALAGVLGVAVLYAAQPPALAADLIAPQVSVAGIQMAGLTRGEAEAALRARYGEFVRQPVLLRTADRAWQPTLEDLGVMVDFAGAVNAAHTANRVTPGILPLGGTPPELPVVELALAVSADETTLRAYVASIAADVDTAPIDATLELMADGVAATPAADGVRLDTEALVAQLRDAITRRVPIEAELPLLVLTPDLTDAGIAAAQSQAAALLIGPVELAANETRVSWDLATLAQLLVLTRIDGTDGDTMQVTIDRPAVVAQLTPLLPDLEQPGTLPRVAWNEGKLAITRAGEKGWAVDEVRAPDAIITALSNGSRAVVLPMKQIDPPVTAANLRQLGIDEVVSVGRSDFSGSAAYRITNIQAGMRLLDGILIPPGEEFSFNANVGSIDAARGFVEGSAIVDNRTQKEFGGGICQDSTTVFRAAFWAGLPITERYGHSFYISWYDRYGLGEDANGAGLDATIFTGGGPDLKFLNDTGAWMLMGAFSDPKSGLAQIILYGTKPDRQVSLTRRVYNEVPAPQAPVYAVDREQPRGRMRQSDTARGGRTIDVFRTVTVNGVAGAPERFRTIFRPWPNIFVVHPSDMGADGRPVFLSRPAPAPTVDPALPTVDPAAPAPLPTADPAAPAPVPGTEIVLPPPAQDAAPEPIPAPTPDPAAAPQP